MKQVSRSLTTPPLFSLPHGCANPKSSQTRIESLSAAPKGLAASRFANAEENGDGAEKENSPAAAAVAAEGENEPDNSSEVLASVRTSPLASQ